MSPSKTPKGHAHPLSLMIREINGIFSELGFSFAEGPEAESEWYNFDALNVPSDHPARDVQDTFFFEKSVGTDKNRREVLRTQTSPVQIRYMEKHGAPTKIIVPGKVFRNEATDATHEAQFFQVEGLWVDKGITMGHLKGTLQYFFEKFFGGEIETRLRPSFFPFTEPSVEVAVKIDGDPKTNKLVGRWIELMGAGMVHPNVLKNAGIDPTKYQGFAFGIGVDRLAILKYGIDDVRLSYGGDLRFVNQF